MPPEPTTDIVAPVDAAPIVAAPAVTAEAAPAPVVEAAPEAAVVAEPAPSEAAPEPVVGSLVEGAPEAAAVEPEAAKPAEAEVAPEPAPTYEAFKLPEGFTVPEDRMGAFTELAGKQRLSQEDAQSFLDLHAETMKTVQAAMDQRQRDVFDQTRAGWRDQFAKEAGNRRDTMLQDAKWAISELEPDEAKRKEVWSALSFSGMGDHPAIIRLLSNAAGKMRERTAPATPLAPERGAINPADRRYGVQRTA